MNAIRYLKERERMCAFVDGICTDCPMARMLPEDIEDCDSICVWEVEPNYPQEAVRIVEEWSDGHKVVTNRDKFIEVFGVGSPPTSELERISFTTEGLKAVYDSWWNKPYEGDK